MRTPYVLTIVSVFLLYKTTSAQYSSNPVAANTVYLEAFGMGGYGSLNYERLVLRHKDLHVGVRLGAGTYRLRDFETNINPDLTVPFAVNAYYGKTHHIELGVGQTFTSIVKASQVDFKVTRDNTFSSNINLGYRYQKSSRGMMFRINYNPIISTNSVFKHWYGVSIGYSF